MGFVRRSNLLNTIYRAKSKAIYVSAGVQRIRLMVFIIQIFEESLTFSAVSVKEALRLKKK